MFEGLDIATRIDDWLYQPRTVLSLSMNFVKLYNDNATSDGHEKKY